MKIYKYYKDFSLITKFVVLKADDKTRGIKHFEIIKYLPGLQFFRILILYFSTYKFTRALKISSNAKLSNGGKHLLLKKIKMVALKYKWCLIKTEIKNYKYCRQMPYKFFKLFSLRFYTVVP